MKVDLFLPVYQPEEVGPLARRAEELGFDGLWLAESSHNPFIALGLAAATTERILLGTDVAVALARSPAAGSRGKGSASGAAAGPGLSRSSLETGHKQGLC